MSYGQHSIQTSSLGVVAALALLASTPASAQEANGYSIDIEFLRPSFGHEAFTGVDVPRGFRNLTVRAGTLLQYQQAPLTLYDAVQNTEINAVVTNRFSAMVGASIDVSRVTFGVLLPTALNWGTEQPQFGADGFGLGDIGASARLTVLKTKNDFLNAGIRGGVVLPTGRPQSYIGESRLRLAAGGLVAFNFANVLTVATDLGVMSRSQSVETSEDFVAGSEVTWGNAARLYLPAATRTSLNAQVLARAGLQEFLRGGAENSLEALAGVDFYPSKRTTIGIAAGRGLTEGYGTTDLRVLGNLVVEIAPPEPAPPIYTQNFPPPPKPDEPAEIPIVEPVFEAGELAVKFEDRIEIAQMLEFFVDTNRLKPESRPVLSAVSDLINKSPEIGHLIIEGHASQEGSFENNYRLAESRARRIWELMLEEGVASERISYRGKGEVEPLVGEVGQDDLEEEQLQENRRVEFRIVRYLEIDEVVEYPAEQYLPWNGQTVPVVNPAPPPPEDTGPVLDEFGMPIDEDISFEDEDLDLGDGGDESEENP